MRTVQEVEEQLAVYLQLCYDVRVVKLSNRYIFVDQFLDGKLSKMEAVIAVKSFSRVTSVTSEILYNAIIQDSCKDA